MNEFKKIENRFIENLTNFNNQDEALAKFSSLWNDINSYSKHIKKRMRNKDIESEFEYLVTHLKYFPILMKHILRYILKKTLIYGIEFFIINKRVGQW